MKTITYFFIYIEAWNMRMQCCK